MKIITYEDVRGNNEFNTYIQAGDRVLETLGYTDHSFSHTVKVAEKAAEMLTVLGYSKREIELARIAGYIHDIGNVINRVNHALTGASIACGILTRMEMPPEEIAVIMGAVGNHDEDSGMPVSAVGSALIIADKTDVRRSRVRNNDFATFDIHDRVNYAVEQSVLTIKKEDRTILLDITLDISICSVMDYFEIFLTRMIMCRRAAEYIKAEFMLVTNGVKVL